MKRSTCVSMQAVLAGAGAYLSSRFGILFPLLMILMVMMVIDYISGMIASTVESICHQGDAAYGWSSKKGAIGIAKKVAYLFVIAVAMVVDYIILRAAAEFGAEVSVKAVFGLLVTVWYILNELLSIVENAGRMGAPVPEWLARYIAALKNKIDSEGDNQP